MFSEKYYAYVPDSYDCSSGRYCKLAAAEEFPVNGIVVVPYFNPDPHGIQASYFDIVAEQKTALADEKSSEVNKPISFTASLSRAEYIQKVQQLKSHIRRGDIYEINFCMEFVAERTSIDPAQTFKKLCEISKAPYNFLLRIGNDYILCASPELFLKKTGQELITKPIKGTAKRGINKEEDEAIKNQLFNSLKERTENVMAVDVARNDLSILAEKGTVKVNKLYNIESFETVHQMVSTVSCLMKNQNFTEILQATFPMASMTGAPKISAMKLIDKTENFDRGFYSGCIGAVSNSDFELAVVIRSLFYNSAENVLKFATGGAITYLSDPEQEYEECILKAQTILMATNGFIVRN